MLTPVAVTGVCAHGSSSPHVEVKGRYRGERVEVTTSECDWPNQGAPFWVEAAGGADTLKRIFCRSREVPRYAKRRTCKRAD